MKSSTSEKHELKDEKLHGGGQRVDSGAEHEQVVEENLWEESQNRILSLTGNENMERVGEDLISATEGQVSCKEGRKEISKPGTTGSSDQGEETLNRANRAWVRALCFLKIVKSLPSSKNLK